ncbi:hypothetical protein MAR_035486 [Mya arenaria]|uniref:Ig-like domain-containing protein n=1 Tax=Mya arenaria TaxID=6604 RepID=A0ABY7EKN6_MYAAR|nr:hypothetical protein MAR_035486 [Mya arenaria]
MPQGRIIAFWQPIQQLLDTSRFSMDVFYFMIAYVRIKFVNLPRIKLEAIPFCSRSEKNPLCPSSILYNFQYSSIGSFVKFLKQGKQKERYLAERNGRLKVVRWNVLCLLLTIAVTQGDLMLTADKQYAQLQGDLMLTADKQYAQLQVDINSVNLTPKTNLISCVTSTCRPVATISWYLGSKLIKTGKESNTLQDVTTSTLNYTFKKKHQDKRIICRGIPPVVKPLTNVTVLEEGTVSVVCEVTAGVPSKNDFKWDRMSDSTNVSMEQSLSIANIDRKQTGYYRCTASNYMEPTGHDATVGISSNTVYIDVQYEAEVTSFTLLNAYHGQNFEVNENTQVIFYCQAHSAPRASALSQRDQNVTIAPGEPAAFTLKLVAFPRPRAKDFVWEKKVSASNDSAGSVIAGAVCGTLAVVVVVTVVVVILRRKYTVNCNFERKRDNPENNAVHTYDELSVPNAASVNDALNDRGNGPDDPDLYTPLDESRSTNAEHYEDVSAKKEDPVYYNVMLTNPL